MAIVKSKSRARVSKPNLSFSPESVGGMSSSSSDDSDGSNLSGYDSGMESDGSDLVDASARTEAVRLGNQSFSLPIELYDLNDLGSILSVNNWNELLSEEERFYLSKYLPDMGQEGLSKTLIELFSAKNFHFGSPVHDFFHKLKGGEFVPEVSLYHQGLSSLLKRQHYHQIRKYHDSMVSGLSRIKNAWENCQGYGIEERLRLLNIMRSRRDFGEDNDEDFGSKIDREDGHFRNKKIKLSNENSEGCRVAPLEVFGKPGQKAGIIGHDHESNAYGDHNGSCRSNMAKGIPSKSEKKNQFLRRCDEVFDEDYAHLPDLSGRKKIANEVTIASYAYDPHTNRSKSKHFDEDWMYSTKIHPQDQMLRGDQVDYSGSSLPTRHSVMHDERNLNSKKWKMQEEFHSHKKRDFDALLKPCKAIPAFESDAHLYTPSMSKSRKEKKDRMRVSQTEGMELEYSKGRGMSRASIMFDQSEETESDSSEQDEDDADVNPWVKRLEQARGITGHHESPADRSAYDSAKFNQFSGNVKNPYILPFEARANIHAPEFRSYPRQGKQKSYSREKRQEGAVHHAHSLPRSNYRHEYKKVQREKFQYEFDMHTNLPNGHASLRDTHNKEEEPYMPLLARKTGTKKRNLKQEGAYQEEQYESVDQQLNDKKMDEQDTMKRRKIDAAAGFSNNVSPDTNNFGKGMLDIELETRSQKKTYTLITPTIHTGFSFSIIHLLSAIRKAMITSDAEDMADRGNHMKNNGPKREVTNGTNITSEYSTKSPHSPKNMDARTTEQTTQSCFPPLTIQEIANRVQTNPGDPCILETQEPLQDLIRGVLKIFSSKTAPLGAKGWKALVSYEKSNKGWAWVGPVSLSSSENDSMEEETSPEAWGIPYKMLLNLVNAFANWLKSSQETLKQLGSLPPPPVSKLTDFDEKERFKDLRTQKNPATINPSSDEQRVYFRKQEFLRYSIPDRAFSYMAADGKKSSVAPLRRGAGKPTSKARDHYILKIDRPPHVTILCLVRDAAARLPGSIGTRADICTLLRDSQYIVEDVTPAQVNQVVSGALDRLHYELDPCIHFDNDRKLWVYLHGDRQEEDFEDDGTASTKNWKRPRKDAAEHYDMEVVNDGSYHGNEDPSEFGSSTGFDLNSVVNVES